MRTLIVGVVPASVSVFAPESVQLESGKMSPNFNVVRVCAASKVTVRLAVMLMVLKSAVEPDASATMPLSQFTAPLQLPLASFVQVPLAALRFNAPARNSRQVI